MSCFKMSDAYRVKVATREASAQSPTLADVCRVLAENRTRLRVDGTIDGPTYVWYEWARATLAARLDLP